MEEGRSSSDSGRDSPTDERVRAYLYAGQGSTTEDSADERPRTKSPQTKSPQTKSPSPKAKSPTPQSEASKLAMARKLSPTIEATAEERVHVYEVRESPPLEGAIGGVPPQGSASLDPVKVLIPRLELGGSDDDEGAVDLGLPYSDGEFTSGRTNTGGRAVNLDNPDTPISSVASELSARALSHAISEIEAEHQVREAIEAVSNEFVSGETGYFNHSLVDENDDSDEAKELDGVVKKLNAYHICEPWSDHDVGDAWSTASSKEITPRDPDSRGSTLVGTGEFCGIRKIVADLTDEHGQLKSNESSPESRMRNSPTITVDVPSESYLRRSTERLRLSPAIQGPSERMSPSLRRSTENVRSLSPSAHRFSPSGAERSSPVRVDRYSPSLGRSELLLGSVSRTDRLSPSLSDTQLATAESRLSPSLRYPPSGSDRSSPLMIRDRLSPRERVSPSGVRERESPSLRGNDLIGSVRSPGARERALFEDSDRMPLSRTRSEHLELSPSLASRDGDYRLEPRRSSSYHDQLASKSGESFSPLRAKKSSSYTTLDTEAESEFASLPAWRTSEDDENSGSIVSRSTYRPLPGERRQRDEESPRNYETDPREFTRGRNYETDPRESTRGRNYEIDPRESTRARNYEADPRESTRARNYEIDPRESTRARNYERDPGESTRTQNYETDPRESTRARNYERDPGESTRAQNYETDPRESTRARNYESDPRESTRIRDYETDPRESTRTRNDDFEELQSRPDLTDYESDLTVQELLRRCERELLGGDSASGSGSVISDDLSEAEENEQLAKRVKMLLESANRAEEDIHDEYKVLDDSLSRRIRALLEECTNTSMQAAMDQSPRASPRSIRELIHSISINRSADSDVHRELEDIEENWKHNKSRLTPLSRAESSASAATVQSKTSDEFSKKRLAWDYGADLSEGNLPQFVASVEPQDETRSTNMTRARSASPPRTMKDSLTFPTKSTSLLSVNKSASGSALSALGEGKLLLANRVLRLLQKDSPQEHAYSILREAEEQEKRLATKTTAREEQELQESGGFSVPERDTYRRSREGSTSELRNSRDNLLGTASSSSTNAGRYECYSGRRDETGRPDYSDFKPDYKSSDLKRSRELDENVVQGRKSLSTTALDRSPKDKKFPENESSFKENETDVSARASRSLLSDWSPVSNKPYLAASTAQCFISNQLKRANDRQFSPSSSQRTDPFQGKTRPSILRGFIDRNETDHEASREISRIQANDVIATRPDLVTLRQAGQHRDLGSSIETSQGETTMESTHTGSDDAQAPSFPSFAYGTRVNTTAPHKVGVYGRRSGEGFPRIEETADHSGFPGIDDTAAVTDRSASSTVSRKRAWVEEQIEDLETERSQNITTDRSRMTADELFRASCIEERREPRRSLQILQEILEKESDSEGLGSGHAWQKYQEKKRGVQRTENVMRLLKSLVREKREIPQDGQITSRSTLSAFSSIKTEGSVKFPPESSRIGDGSDVTSQLDSAAQMAGILRGETTNFDLQTPRSENSGSSRDTDEELRYRMATLLDQADSLTSIPEADVSIDEDKIKRSLPKYDDPHLANLHMKIRLQREKYLQGRRREQRRKEKIQKLQRILDAKSVGKDVSDSSSTMSTLQSITTTTVDTSDWSVSAGDGDATTKCRDAQHESNGSYCPCKLVISPPGRENVALHVRTIESSKASTLQSRYENRKLLRSLESETGKPGDTRSEISVKLVSEGTQTSPGLGRAVPKKKSKRTKVSREKVTITDSSNIENTPPSRKTREEDRAKKPTKKPGPRTAHGGLCWFVPLNDAPKRREMRPLKNLPRPYNNIPKEEITSGAEFCLDRNNHEQNSNKISLQDAFSMFKQSFISRSRQRQKRVRLVGQQKRMDVLHEKQRAALFSFKKRLVPNVKAHPLSDQWYRPSKRYFTKNEMKVRTEKVYRQLPEVLEKAELKKREAEYRNNRLRAEIYKRKQLGRALLTKF